MKKILRLKLPLLIIALLLLSTLMSCASAAASGTEWMAAIWIYT